MGDQRIEDANLANDKYVKQLKKVNYGIVVGLKAAKSELRRLRKAARYTSRPEAPGSGPEAVFRFLGSGVDFV